MKGAHTPPSARVGGWWEFVNLIRPHLGAANSSERRNGGLCRVLTASMWDYALVSLEGHCELGHVSRIEPPPKATLLGQERARSSKGLSRLLRGVVD